MNLSVEARTSRRFAVVTSREDQNPRVGYGRGGRVNVSVGDVLDELAALLGRGGTILEAESLLVVPRPFRSEQWRSSVLCESNGTA